MNQMWNCKALSSDGNKTEQEPMCQKMCRTLNSTELKFIYKEHNSTKKYKR